MEVDAKILEMKKKILKHKFKMKDMDILRWYLVIVHCKHNLLEFWNKYKQNDIHKNHSTII